MISVTDSMQVTKKFKVQNSFICNTKETSCMHEQCVQALPPIFQAPGNEVMHVHVCVYGMRGRLS